MAETDGEEDEKVKRFAVALANDEDPSDFEIESYDHYGLTIVSCGRRQYAVGTDEEADKAAKANIKDSLWAFNASFLASFTDLPEEIFKALQPQCENSNEAVLALVERTEGGLDSFVEDAVSADGRGHFLSGYDGDETEQEVLGTTYYIYRIN